MKIKKIGIVLLSLLTCNAVFADPDVPCRVENNVVLCPYIITNEGLTDGILKTSFGNDIPVPGHNVKEIDLPFPPVSESTVTLTLLDQASQQKGCKYTFMIIERDGIFYGNDSTMEVVGSPKMCEMGGGPELTTEGNLDPYIAH